MTQMSKRQIVWLLSLLLSILQGVNNTEWNNCLPCSCKWKSGKKQAACDNLGLEDVPTTLSEEIQFIVLDNNKIRVLKNNVFYHNKLLNLQKLSLKNCSITTIENNAFHNLELTIEIDLSNNEITKLDPLTFRSNKELRWLHLDSNKLQRIEDGLLTDLPVLQSLELSNNQISYISNQAFNNTLDLKSIKLNNNRLKQISVSMFDRLVELRSLELMDNPWNCDCHMQKFVSWYKKKNLYTHPIRCSQPAFLENQAWHTITNNSFTCKPKIVSLMYRLDEDNQGLYLTCEVRGNPLPKTYIIFNAHILSHNDTLLQSNGLSKYTINKYDLNDKERHLLNVTVHEVTRQDCGTYICSAKNEAGLVESNVTFNCEL